MLHAKSQTGYIRDLFGIFFSGDIKGKLMGVMYGGYMDDSADRDRERVVISAMLVGNFDDWKYLTKQFGKRLKRDQLEYFKSSQCNHLRRQFHKFRDLGMDAARAKADSVRDDLDRIIKKSHAMGIGVVIPIPVFEKLKAEPRYATIIPNDPYDWAVQGAWNETVGALLKIGRNCTITVAHDDGNNFQRLHGLFKSYKRCNPKAAKVLRDFVPLDDKTNSPIQAADIVADVTFRFAEEWAINPTSDNMRRLRENMHRVCIWDEAYMRANLDQMLTSDSGVFVNSCPVGGKFTLTEPGRI